METDHTTYFNMCNHYSRLYNAKPKVDTSTPMYFRKTMKKDRARSTKVEDKLAFNSHKPSDNVFDSKKICAHISRSSTIGEKLTPRKTWKTYKSSRTFESTLTRNISKTTAEDSSEDSAYNEGSRGSTPQQFMRTGSAVSRAKHLIDKNAEEANVLKFMKDITDDIIRKKVVTNKAMKNIFQLHMKRNSSNLSTEKIKVAIAELENQLGIPHDDTLDDVGYGLGYDLSKLRVSEPVPEHLKNKSIENVNRKKDQTRENNSSTYDEEYESDSDNRISEQISIKKYSKNNDDINIRIDNDLNVKSGMIDDPASENIQTESENEELYSEANSDTNKSLCKNNEERIFSDVDSESSMSADEDRIGENIQTDIESEDCSETNSDNDKITVRKKGIRSETAENLDSTSSGADEDIQSENVHTATDSEEEYIKKIVPVKIKS